MIHKTMFAWLDKIAAKKVMSADTTEAGNEALAGKLGARVPD
jgi:hypothetical protein